VGASAQNRKYNGKEFVEMHGWDEYDSEARWMYPAIMRTSTLDPLAEKYYSTSPYAWCGGNPVRMVDPDGMDWYSYQEEYKDKDGNKQTRTAYKYVRGEMSKKEIEDGGYTHLGKTYDDKKGTYFSLGGGELKYDKENALSVLAVNKVKSADNSIVATIEGTKEAGDFWDKYGEFINNITNVTQIMSEYLELSKGFKGVVSKFGVLTTVAQMGVDTYSLLNGELKGVKLMDAVVNVASLAGTPGAAISLTYSGTKKAASTMLKLEYSLRTYIPQLIINANNGYWPY
jgi:RHS repeat-associated protein